MRDKMRAAHTSRPDEFDFKHSLGGMIDAEFVVQFLVLAHAHPHPELADNLGNIALLEHAERLRLLPAGLGGASADAYRVLRHLQHQARLDEAPAQVPASQLEAQKLAIEGLWRFVFS